MGRDDRAHGVHDAPGRKGKGHRGRRVMVTRRRESGMDKAAFEQLLRRTGITRRDR
jgi:hypothetical protein